MLFRSVLPASDDLAASCLDVPGAREFPRRTYWTVWIAPADEELRRRRYPMTDDTDRIRSVGAFRDADGRFDHAPEAEAGIFWPCPWGAGATEENLPEIAGALALLLREHAPGVGAVAVVDDVSRPLAFGFVTYGVLEAAPARAAALCTAYVAAGELPPLSLALAAAHPGPLQDRMPEEVRSAVRASLDELSRRVRTAVENVSKTDSRPSP